MEKLDYGNFTSYLKGFVFSVVLTLATYFLAVTGFLSGWVLDLSIGFLAILQAIVQLVFFLNLTKEPKPRWNRVIFLFMVLVVVILVFGSIWIMKNLTYNLMGS